MNGCVSIWAMTKESGQKEDKAARTSHVLVFVQFGTLAALFLLAGTKSRPLSMFLLEGIGFMTVLWAISTMRRNFKIYPDVQEGKRLVTKGPFKVVRHPVYMGILILGYVWASVAGTPLSFLLLGVLLVDLIMKIGREEKSLRERFGDEYKQYRRRTKRLIPFIY